MAERKNRVNWIDGMKINKGHFVQMEEALSYSLHELVKYSLNSDTYGLAPDFTGKSSSVKVNISVDGMNSLEAELLYCKGVTMGGDIIDLDAKTKSLMNESGFLLSEKYLINEGENGWYVVLTVDPYSRVPVGEPDPKEEPPRHPFVVTNYKLNIIPSDQITDNSMGLHHLTIAKIVMLDGIPVLDASYIPPCQSVQSHEDLRFSFREVGQFFNQMESYCMRIIQKIHEKKNNNVLAQKVQYMAENVLHYLNTAIPEYRMLDKNASPVNMITRLVSLSRLIKGSLDIFEGTGKEDLINYLIDWCDLNQGAFENVLMDMSELSYVHGDVNTSLDKVSEFTRLMLALFKKLHELDYIGKKPDSKIFVKEEKIKDEEIKTRRNFFID